MLKLKLFCKLYCCVVVSLHCGKQKSYNDIENLEGCLSCDLYRRLSMVEVLRLGVNAHHARVTVGNLLAIRVFRERFPYFKYCRAKSKSLLILFLY